MSGARSKADLAAESVLSFLLTLLWLGIHNIRILYRLTLSFVNSTLCPIRGDDFHFPSIYGPPYPTFQSPLVLLLSDVLLALLEIIDRAEHWRIRRLKESAHMLGYNDLLSRPSIELNTIWEPIIKKAR